MIFQRETLFDVIDEIQPLLNLHYEELTAHKEIVKLDVQWGKYAALEKMGAFIVFTCRDGGVLLGYNAFFLNTHLHYAGMTVAQNDVFYLSDAARKGSAALRFIRYSESQLKEIGAMKVVYHAKHSNNFAPILHRLGYAAEETMCGKVI